MLEGSLLILSKRGIEHAKEPLRLAGTSWVRLSAPRAAQMQSEEVLQSCTSTNQTTQKVILPYLKEYFEDRDKQYGYYGI